MGDTSAITNMIPNTIPFFLRVLLLIYDAIWYCFAPFLRLSHRLREGFEVRMLKVRPFRKAEVWMHAASAGEAFLARQILKTLDSTLQLEVLVTTNTLQGKAILEKPLDANVSQLTISYAPFDRPTLIKKCLEIVDPKVVLLIELEMWPGLMAEVKKSGKRLIIVNGRMTEKSLGSYIKTRYIWKNLRPNTVLAISEEDKARFDRLFDHRNCHYVPNIKFDRLEKCLSREKVENNSQFLVLASIRKEEEYEVLFLIEKLLEENRELTIGLFPRHMHRLDVWESLLTEKHIPWSRKSKTQGQELHGGVILWDVFGELGKAYRRADAAFVGGSLAPLGGQNFIEAFMSGVIPVTGPSVSNFLWAGDEVYSEGLVRMGRNKEEVLSLLNEALKNMPSSEEIQEMANRYIISKQGGTRITCSHIEKYFRKTVH